MMQQRQRKPTAMLVLALVGLVMVACSGPSDAVSAASFNSSSISMSQYDLLTRLVIGVDQVNDPSVPFWQQIAGKTELGKAQSRVLNLLITNMVLDQDLAKNPTIYHTDQTAIKQAEDAQLKQLFSAVPSQFQPLVSEGLLTPETYRPFVHQQALENALTASPNFTFSTAHIKLLTVKTKAQADDFLAQLKKNNGANWTALATKNSIDSAASAGGDIATVVPYYLPTELNDAVFGPKDTPQGIMEVHNRLGWSLVEVLARSSNVVWSKLDNTVPITANAQFSVAGAAVYGYINHLVHQGNLAVNVNWCNNTSGQNCSAIFPTDLM
jgi:hypothetical protein